ncbi:SRPBCC domain-containing protein [Alkalihalobacillus oceani]|uniref:CoxG family protein n=1 Tax=Halalkalibacter oceani TaxID=1653776 RepID=UPI00203F80D1|nr:SRPBCC domain-containing protein [Halalkalibacter oceani]MCM3761100.1 SRPBCC domain-containing protein [Halalkalibacter oceani]
MKLKDFFTINAPKENVWEVFMNVEKLASCVPGCENMIALSDTEYEADMDVKTKFMKIRFKANGRLKDMVEGEELNVEMVGKPMKLAGLFKTKLKVQLEEVEQGQTKVTYDMDLQMTGRLASLGDVLMKGTVKKSGDEFAENVQALFIKAS